MKEFLTKDVLDMFEKMENKIVPLKKMGNDRVEVSTLLCRSDIFVASKKTTVSPEVFHHTNLGAITIKSYTQLNQDDLDLLLVLLHECSCIDNYDFVISKREILKRLKKGYGKNSKASLDKKLENLSSIIIKTEKQGEKICGSFLRTATTSDGVAIHFFKDLMPLFENATWLNIDCRLSCSNSLTKYLYNFTMSSKIPVKLEALKKLSGKSNIEDRRFKSQVKLSMNELMEKGVVNNWAVDRYSQLCWKKG